MWCVVADNGDEFWVYGVFLNKIQAQEFAEEIQLENPEIEYTVASHLGTTGALDRGKQSKRP